MMVDALPLSLRLYETAAGLATPFAVAFLAARAARGKEDGSRSAERRGHATFARPDGPLFWLHGASVGESVSILPLARRIAARGCSVLMTSGTVTSAAVVAARLPEGAIHNYMPLDIPAFVRRFLGHWRPDVAVFAESELWPSMIGEAHRRHLPLILVNGRMSARSFARWKRFPKTIAALLQRFDLCLAQSPTDAERLSVLGAPRVSAPGNLKFDAPPPPADPVGLAALQQAVGSRPSWVAASTHPGEDEIVAQAHLALKARFPDLLTIVVPRHPERGDAIATSLAALGLNVLQRSRGFLPDRGTEIYVSDTLGELGLFFRLSPIVFVGASLVRNDGHNPVEPAKLASAILHGPHVKNFAEVYAALDQVGGAIEVADGEALARSVGMLLGSPDAVQAMAQRAAEAIEPLTGALDRTMAALEPYLMQIALRRP